MLEPCQVADTAGSSVTTFTNNRFARCTGTPVNQGGGHYVCSGFPWTGDDFHGYVPEAGTDGNGYFPSSGSYGLLGDIFCAQTTWTNNVWDDNDAAVSCS